MKALVCIKSVIDYKTRIRVLSDQSGIDMRDVRMTLNPFDEIAVEEAVRLKEQGLINHITVVSIGSDHARDTLKTTLAMGTDEALHYQHPDALPSLVVAKILQHATTELQPDIILLGKQAIDDDACQTGQMLAALCDFSLATFASQIVKKADTLEVTREVDGGLETLELTLPAVITTDLRLNTPRHISLPALMRAKKKDIATRLVSELPLSLVHRLQVLSVSPPPVRKKGTTLPDVQALLSTLTSTLN